jgi:hypothetical protein
VYKRQDVTGKVLYLLLKITSLNFINFKVIEDLYGR